MTQSNGDRSQRPELLASQLSTNLSGKADHVFIGLNWTAVVGPLGVGLAHSPARGASGCNGLPAPGSYAGQKLAEIATARTWTSPNHSAPPWPLKLRSSITESRTNLDVA